MWLAIKEQILKDAARKRPPGDLPETEEELKPVDKLHINELGTQGAIHYRRLLGRFPSNRYPEAQIGPDETIEHHYSRLKSLLNDELAPGQAELSRAREKGKLSPQTTYEETVSKPISQPWVGDLPTGNPTVTDLKGMPQRIPGQFTTGNPEFGTKPFSGYVLPPENQPLHTTRAPMQAPQQQSMQDWVNFLRGKGITLNHQLMRPDAVQMQGPMPQGQDIWSDFVGKTTPESYHQYLKDQPAGPNTFGKSWKQRAQDLFRRRRSSTIVNEYISGVLTGDVLPALTAAVSPGPGWRTDDGENFYKEYGDRTHVLSRQPDSWAWNTGPAGKFDEYGDPEMDGNPRFFDTLESALLHINQVPNQRIRAVPPSHWRQN